MKIFLALVIFTSLSILIPRTNSACTDCPADAPVKWTSVENCGCDFRGPQGAQGSKGATGPVGPRGPFGPGAAEPLSPGTIEYAELEDVYHYQILGLNPGNTAPTNSYVVSVFTIGNAYDNEYVRAIVKLDLFDRCPQGTASTAPDGFCSTSETPRDTTFTYQLGAYSVGYLPNNTFSMATLLDQQTVQFKTVAPDQRQVILQGVVYISAGSSANRFLYLNIKFQNPNGLLQASLDPNGSEIRRMRIVATSSVLGFPLDLNSSKKRDIDAEYRAYFMEEAINPSTIETNFL